MENLPIVTKPEKTLGYVCTGCGIGEHLDAERLAAVATDALGAPAAVRPPLCLPEQVRALRADLEQSGATRAVIAACSERVNFDVFSPEALGLDLVGRANIRELVAWTTTPGDEEGQMAAEDYFRMSIAKTKGTRPPALRPHEVETTLLVVGGGVTGMTAALEAARAGHDVILVEKQPTLGGWAARLHKTFPTRSPYTELEPVAVDALIDEVAGQARIAVYTSSEVARIAGEPGAFEVTIEGPAGTTVHRAGAAVVATGWQLADGTAGLEHLGYGSEPDVITNADLEAMARDGSLARPSDRLPARRVAIVMRPPSSGDKQFSFGSNVLDMVSLKQALLVREIDPSAQVYLIYEDVVTPGLYEAFYRRVQQEPNVFFVKGDVARVERDGSGSLLLHLERSLLGPTVAVQADLVVLAVGMVPSAGNGGSLNLIYQQGSDLPTTKFGFSDSNFICFPYETRRTGLYSAGAVREAMDIAFSVEDATGAALKAIQSLELAASGRATHPRTGDLSLPETRLQGCTKCGRCSEECPFSAIEVDERGFPTLNPDRCRRCGICMGACPVRVISFEDYSVEQLTAMVKAIEFPSDETKPRILALACENDAYPAFDMAGINRLSYDASVRVIPLRCLGSLNVAVVADALSAGIDGIMLLGCKSGDNYQCHFMQGSELAGKRMGNVKETLSRLMIEPERVQPLELEISEYDRIPGIVGRFVEEVKAMGPNPYKGM